MSQTLDQKYETFKRLKEYADTGMLAERPVLSADISAEAVEFLQTDEGLKEVKEWDATFAMVASNLDVAMHSEENFGEASQSLDTVLRAIFTRLEARVQ